MKPVASCNFCGNKRFVTIYRHLDDKMHKVPGKQFSIIKCKRCSLVVTTPMIQTRAEFARYYPEQYYSYNPPSKRRKFSDRVALFLYNLFYNPKQRFNPVRYLLFPLSQFVRGTLVLPGKAILDVGCGGGYFLQRMKDLGMRPYGIELGKRGVQECKRRGFPVWSVPIQEAPIKEGFFAVISISAVLEHVIDVKATLHASHRALKEGGSLVILVPNARGFSARWFGKYWAEWDIPRHITHFTEETLRAYLEEAGFTDIHIKHVGSSFQFTQSLLYKYPRLGWLFTNQISAMLFNGMVVITNLFGVPGRLEAYASKPKQVSR